MSSNNKLEYKDGDGLAKSSLKSPSSLSRTMQFRMNTETQPGELCYGSFI